jgi:hypothetical protein
MGVKVRERKPKDRVSDELLAYHEAGHVVAAHRLYRPNHRLPVFKLADSVTIEPDDEGYVNMTADRRVPSQLKDQLVAEPETRDDLRGLVEDTVVSLLAGFAAEHRKEKLPKEEAWGFVDVFAYAVVNKERLKKERIFAEHTDVTEAWEYLEVFEPYPVFRREWLRELFGRTWQSIGDWWPDIERVANALLEKRTLSAPEITDLLCGCDKSRDKNPK